MRQPRLVNAPQRQQGFVLFMVLAVMMVVALFVVAAVQSYNTEQRISANDADRKFAASLAEAALREGERRAVTLDREGAVFTADCADGLCTAVGSSAPAGRNDIVIEGAPTVPAVSRRCGNALCLDNRSRRYNVGGLNTNKDPRYLIEFIRFDAETGEAVYRVSAQGRGRIANTAVVVQSYVRVGANAGN
ncbi:pilus assembly PilX family protein [Bergeriella denitrificans]|uniref:Type IV pilus biogenesis protein PilK n=1 Tax=Bergeriella denitrificans TaxID=494 RepID=A0A378UH85_BERDE|nr:PilX N-terminal domain-containing pilus assembly protein [Bergeriella denitrificans]STZ76738.1 type IV pilus biogenesis protein PilK [Bergeriella denitrificans]